MFWPDMTDLYLADSTSRPVHRWYPAGQPVPDEHLPFVDTLIQACREQPRQDFRVCVQGVAFRGTRMESLKGCVYALRRMPAALWRFDALGYPDRMRKYMLHPRHSQGGLWIISGMPGAGKSTASATVMHERLRLFGGVGISVEDPPEMPLEGPHGGHGYCYQLAVTERQGFAALIRDSMRVYPAGVPGILQIGEVRDGETAHLALRAAIDGRLVIATMHAGSIPQALERLVSLAAGEVEYAQARQMLASSLRLAVHQRLTRERGAEAILAPTFLIDTQAAATIIQTADKPVAHLRNEIDQQQRRIASGDAICARD